MILFFATIIPGPNMLLALSHGTNYGVNRTLYSSIGNTCTNFFMALTSFLGLGVILLTSGVIFSAIKYIGALYLIYLGIRLFFTKTEEQAPEKESLEAHNKRNITLFTEGFVIGMGNPKGIIFFTALFPQFISHSSITPVSMATLFVPLVAIAWSCYMIYAFFGQKLKFLFSRRRFKSLFNKITGSLMVCLGISLGFSRK
jgi:threonine/homoserine/homoserine lactone efflux protein